MNNEIDNTLFLVLNNDLVAVFDLAQNRFGPICFVHIFIYETKTLKNGGMVKTIYYPHNQPLLFYFKTGIGI